MAELPDSATDQAGAGVRKAERPVRPGQFGNRLGALSVPTVVVKATKEI
jgi:hypothetical protein